MRLSSLRRSTILGLTGIAMVSAGCFGSFNLTRKVYGFNKTVSKDKFVRELVFLGMNVVPIYGIAAFVDGVIANSVEFWTGDNPISMSSTYKIDANTKVQQWVMNKDGAQVMTLKTFKSGALVASTVVKLERDAEFMTFETTYPDGRKESHVTALNRDGKAVVASTVADLQKAGVLQ